MGLPILKRFIALLIQVPCYGLGCLSGILFESTALGQSPAVAPPVGYVHVMVPAKGTLFTSTPFDPFTPSVSGVMGEALTSGRTEKTADQLLIWNSETQGYEYLRKSMETTTATESVWIKNGLSNEPAIRIQPGVGFGIKNHQIFDQSVYLRGILAMDPGQALHLDAGSMVTKNDAGPATAYWCYYKSSGGNAWEMDCTDSGRFSPGTNMLPRIVNLDLFGNQVVLTVSPARVAGERLEVYALAFTNLCRVEMSFGWTVAATDLAAKNNMPLDIIDPHFISMADKNNGFGRLYLVARGDIDSDGDGLPDAREEFVHHTNPVKNDTDGDGIPDGWEVAHQFNPRVSDAHFDPDGDGFSNAEEYARGTDPRDNKSSFVTWYVDGTVGNDLWSGRASVFDAKDGPVRRINMALGKAVKGDRVEVAGGTYHENVDIASLSVDFVLMGDVDLK